MIVAAVRGGSYLDDAASYAGVGERTVYAWLARGRDAEKAYEQGQPINVDEQACLQFQQAVQKARADAVVRNVALIQRAAEDGSWQAAAWYLERTNPRKWGRRDTVEVTGEDGGPVRVEVDHKAALLDLLGLNDADSDDD
jgi:hypothetical protein